ncbi:YiiX family permuted papain-like enzyme [Lysobacter firmicutimachus]|uniref:YiiX family permuted papain-like enzyme n=1 Tax=Lysobacter firmicutimachus TaxID=1792846 RepID=A0ABU8D8E1_9GAMM
MRRAPTPLFAPLFALLLAASAAAQARLPAVRDGDLIFQVSRSSQSQAIQRATGSRYSHMGVILHRDGRPYVFEAIDPVSYTPLATWIARGERGHYVLKRLRTPPDAAQQARLRAQAAPFLGRRYDLAFEWSDRRIYCSELAWKLYKRGLGLRIGQTRPLRSFRLDDPAVKAKLRERYGKRVPLDEPVIAPAAMFDSPLLRTVASG